MKHSTPDLMKFKKLQRRLGVPKYAAVGLLDSLWIATQKNAPRGDIGKFDNEEIAIEIGWEGDPDELIAAFVDLGWLDKSKSHRLIVHDWPAHAPRYVHGVVAKSGGFVADYSGELQSPTIEADCTEQQPNLTKHNITKPNLTKDNSSESASGSDPVVVRFPVTGDKKNPEWHLVQSHVDRLAEAFPGVDVPAEARKALSWIMANPTKTKTARGMPKYLHGWMERNQNRGRGSPSAATSTKQPFDLEAWAKQDDQK